MLTRQRVILALLDRAGVPIQNTTFVKLAFLLREETAVGRDRSFYGFVPYQQGLFSFGMYRELETLERDGYLERGKQSIGLASRTKKLSRQQIERLTRTQTDAVASVVREYGGMKRTSLLRSVYDRYPWYASKSELAEYVPKEVPRSPKREVATYTVGYEGKSVDEGATPEEAAGKVKQKFLGEICAPEKETYFCVGTVLKWPTSRVVIGVFYPRKGKSGSPIERTGELFT